MTKNPISKTGEWDDFGSKKLVLNRNKENPLPKQGIF